MSNLKIKLDEIPAKGLEQMPVKPIKELAKEISKMTQVTLPEEPGLNYGIEETKDVIAFGAALSNGIIKSLADGKVTVGDIPNFFSPMIKLPSAITGIQNVPKELADLDEIELQELIQYVMENLEVDSAKAQDIIKRSLELIHKIYELVKVFAS